MNVRPYDPERDADELWMLKHGFELGLGERTGGDDKAVTYEEKLTDVYRKRYLAWVDTCVADDERLVTVTENEAGDGLVGYVFVLPDRLAMIWDAAVLNEIFVDPEHRGSEVADDLMDAAVGVAREQDLPLDRLVLDVDRGNERARRFYERHGFSHWGEMIARPL